MNLRSSCDAFAAYPWLSVVLAVLIAVLGIVFMSGWVPVSANRRYLVNHAWVMALCCGALAVFLGNCARLGFGYRRERRK